MDGPSPHPDSTPPGRNGGRGGAGGRLPGWLWALAGLACVLVALGFGDGPRPEPSAPAPAQGMPLLSIPVRVLGETEEEPVGGASVRFFRAQAGNYEYVADLTTGVDGVALARVPAGEYWVLVRAPGRARLAQPVVLQGERDLRLTVAAATTPLVIRVRDGEEPVEGAAVLVTAGDQLPVAGTTDGEGRVALEGLRGGSRAVRVVARGYEPFEATTSAPELEVQLRRALGLRVVVRDTAGAPVGGAEVQLSGPQLWPTRRVDTNPSGEVVITGLAAGTYDVFARADSRISDTLRGMDLRHGVHERGVHTVEIVLREGRFLAVEVVDGEGRPVPAADLVLAEAGVAAFPVAARTNDGGRARLGPLRWHQAHLSVRADGFVPRSLWVGVDPIGASEPLRVELVRGGTLVGRVVDERGFPVEGVSLEVIGTDVYGMPVALTPESGAVRKAHFDQVLAGPAPLVPAGELGVMPGPVPPIPLVGAAVPGVSVLADVLQSRWTTDGRGRFRAGGVSPGELRVLARHPEFVDSVSDPVRLAAGGEAEVEVVLRAGRRIEGRLVDADGFPVALARVRLQASRGAFDRTLLTRPDGTFAVAVAPKDLVVSVFGVDDPLRVALRRAVTLGDDPREQLELVLPAPRKDVRFVVLDEREEPVPVAQVTVLSLDPEVPLRETRFSAADGSVELSAAAGVQARVAVESPGVARRDGVWAELPEEGRLGLRRATAVTGRVTAVRGRQPAPGARVVFRGEGVRREARADLNGEYRLGDVPPGAFTVSVEHPELGRGSLEVTVTRRERDRPFEVPTIDLVEAAVVRGRVLDAAGEAVPGARVAVGVVPAYLPQGALPQGVVVTDGAGEFVLEGVEAGRRTVSAQAPGVGRGSATVVLGAGDEHRDLVIRLTEPPAEDGHDWRGGIAVTLGERDGRRGPVVVLVHVAEGSEAERAGLQAGDVLLEVDGHAVDGMADARQRLGGPAGSDVVLALSRGGSTVRTRVARESLSR